MKERIIELLKKVLPVRLFDFLYSILNRIRINFSRIRHKKAFEKKHKGIITIVFLVYVPQSWNSLKTVYFAALKNKKVKAYLVVSPEIIAGKKVIKREVFDFFKTEAPDAIKGFHNGKLFDLKSLNPDIVFRQTPYDEVYPRPYNMKCLAKYTKPCYIPYNYNFSPDKHLIIEYNPRFMANVFAIFSECHSNYLYCNKVKRKYQLDLNVFDMGFPRFDLIKDDNHKLNDKKMTFTWIPRWSLDKVENDITGFFDYKDLLLDFFQRSDDCQLIIRPHPLMFSHFIKKGVMTKIEVEEFIAEVDKMKNVEFDSNMDYLDTFRMTDVLIADFSSLLFEYYLTTKPIIYCGDVDEYNAETKNMMKLLYKINSGTELIERIKMLIEGKDNKFNERKEDVQNILKTIPDNIGGKIVKKCVKICSR